MKNIFYLAGCMVLLVSCQHRGSSEEEPKPTQEYVLLENMVNAFTPESDILFWQMDIVGDPYVVEYADVCRNDTDFYTVTSKSRSPYRVHMFNVMSGPKPLPERLYQNYLGFQSCVNTYVYVHGNEYDEREYLEPFVAKLSQYDQDRDGKMKFPIESFRQLLYHLNFSYAVAYNHDDFPINLAAAMWHTSRIGLGMTRETELSGLTDMRTDDGKAGLLFIQSHYNELFNQSLVLLKSDKGLYIDMWSSKNDTISQTLNFTKVHRIEEGGTSWYVCYNDESIMNFNMVLYRETDDGWMKVEPVWSTSARDAIQTWTNVYNYDADYGNYRILFNPVKKRWDCCYHDGHNYQPFDGSLPISLSFCGNDVVLE